MPIVIGQINKFSVLPLLNDSPTMFLDFVTKQKRSLNLEITNAKFYGFDAALNETSYSRTVPREFPRRYIFLMAAFIINLI